MFMFTSESYNGKSLSEVCSEVMVQQIQEDIGHEDVYAWGAPSECLGLVSRHVETAIAKILHEAGFQTTDEFKDAVVERTTYKFWYDMFGRVSDQKIDSELYWLQD